MMAQVNAGRVRFVGRGEYNNSTQYYVFDLVSYNGNSYYAKVDTIGHLPTDTTYWQLVAEKGNVGPTGLTGNGISSIEKTSTSGLVDTYTITYTNGNTTTFDVSNGNGIDRIEKTATVGNKDTYTIYFTNGSTTTYEVANGEVTREELEEEVERLSMIYNAFPSTTGEGEEPSINGTAEVPFKEIGLKGNTSQDGEPTPDTPIPVNVVTGDNEVKVEGKNLFDKDIITTGKTYTSTGEISNLASSFVQETYISVLPNTAYTLSTTNDYSSIIPGEYRLVLCEYNSSKSFIQRNLGAYDSHNVFTITTTANTYYVRVCASNLTLNELQLEQNSTATSYEPHQSQTYPINLGSMELCKIGDYQDVIKRSSGKNLLKYPYAYTSNSPYTNFDVTWTDNGDGSVTANGTPSGASVFALSNLNNSKIEVEPSTTYTISGGDTTKGVVLSMVEYDNNGNVLVNHNNITTETFTTNSSTKMLEIALKRYSNNIRIDNFRVYPMLELGSIAHDYEPYGKVWCKYGAIGKITFIGSQEENWDIANSGTSSYFYRYRYLTDRLKTSKNDYNCNNYSFANITSTNEVQGINMTNGNELRIRYGTEDTISNFKTWLSTHNTTVYYVLNTPTITPITDTTLIEQLDNLEKAYSYDTQTNISQTNQDKPFIISYEAILSLRNVLNS